METQGKEATVVAEGSPTVRRRELGSLLRGLREEKGMSVKQVTEHLLCSPSKVSRIETGQRGATARDVRDLCDLYGVTDEGERERLMNLAKEGKQQGWWQQYELPYATYIGLEADAVSIKDFDSAVVPGLLQTAAYARAIHKAVVPELSPEIIDQRIEERVRRQNDPGVNQLERFHVVLDEAVLHRVIGGRQVMYEQLEVLAAKAKNMGLTVQVIPYNVGAHPALDSTFNILDFRPPVPSVVYVEGLVGQVYLERPEEIARYRKIFERLCDIALAPKESLELIAKISHDYKSALVISSHSGISGYSRHLRI